MSNSARSVVYWTPRILCIGFAAFLAIFAADVFEMDASPWQLALALGMHLIPSALVLLALAACWKHEWLGGVLFPALAVVHLTSKWGQLHWIAYAAIELPLLLLGGLFLMNWRARRQLLHV